MKVTEKAERNLCAVAASSRMRCFFQEDDVFGQTVIFDNPSFLLK